MGVTVTGKLNKPATQFQAGESTGFGVRVGVKYFDRELKADAWTNYEAVIFAKAPAQIQFYQSVLIEGSVIEITGSKQRIRQFQGANGLALSVEILDAQLGVAYSPPAPAMQQPQQQQQRPQQNYNGQNGNGYQPTQQPQQQFRQQSAYGPGGAAPNNHNPAPQQTQQPYNVPHQPSVNFDDDIPF